MAYPSTIKANRGVSAGLRKNRDLPCCIGVERTRGSRLRSVVDGEVRSRGRTRDRSLKRMAHQWKYQKRDRTQRQNRRNRIRCLLSRHRLPLVPR